MGTNDTVKAILELIDRLRVERKTVTKALDDKIAGLEIAYEALTGKAPPAESTEEGETPIKKARRVRRFKVDRQATEKTFAFVQERGKPTSVAQVARHFHISNAAAIQRCLKLTKLGRFKRVSAGDYDIVTK